MESSGAMKITLEEALEGLEKFVTYVRTNVEELLSRGDVHSVCNLLTSLIGEALRRAESSEPGVQYLKKIFEDVKPALLQHIKLYVYITEHAVDREVVRKVVAAHLAEVTTEIILLVYYMSRLLYSISGDLESVSLAYFAYLLLERALRLRLLVEEYDSLISFLSDVGKSRVCPLVALLHHVLLSSAIATLSREMDLIANLAEKAHSELCSLVKVEYARSCIDYYSRLRQEEEGKPTHHV